MSRVIVRTVLLGLLSFSLNACAESGSSTSATTGDSPQVSLGGQNLSLINVEGKCSVLKPNGARLATKLPWPCQFSQDRNGRARVETFKSTPIVLLTHDERAAESGFDCVQTAQALRLRNGVLEISSVNQAGMCSRGHDQKLFTAMFDW
ncbi:hypothetical protein EGJ27_23595 [Pseudomonas sp. v388]|uniref:hypothetical protein n=1 Tax=Pseudomonas sp. v388 TaxID=2479849 RepID=UPI000F7A1750|nr:hypothetical protein [Pseudomonas sp. v388]RRV03884.1 hypothetical protein EGJ27_23595 [Pseudomonas sp. v388]